MGTVIYRTKQFAPYAEYSKYWNEYTQERDEVIKYVYNKVKYPDRELRNTTTHHEKDRWTIGDDDFPDWLYQYVHSYGLSSEGKRIVKQWRVKKYLADIESHKEQGHYVDEEQKLVVTNHEVKIFNESTEIPQWMNITRLVKEAYNRTRISPKFMESVRNKFEDGEINYDKLQSMATKNEVIKKQREKEKKEKEEAEIFGRLFVKLRKNLVEVKSKLSQEASEDIDFLIGLIDESEISRTSYYYLYKEAQEIILKGKDGQ